MFACTENDSYPCSPHAYHLYLLCFYDLERNAYGCFQCRRKSISPRPIHFNNIYFWLFFSFSFFFFFFFTPSSWESKTLFKILHLREKMYPLPLCRKSETLPSENLNVQCLDALRCIIALTVHFLFFNMGLNNTVLCQDSDIHCWKLTPFSFLCYKVLAFDLICAH